MDVGIQNGTVTIKGAVVHTHTYGAPTWSWTGYSAATASFTCTANDDTQVKEASITSEVTTAATCAAEGVRTYTATVTFGGETYTDTKTEPIAKLAHTLTKHAAVAATCTAEGNIEYWTCDVCHKIFSDANGATEITLADTVVPVDENAHDWGEWTVDTPATEDAVGKEVRTCKNDPSHTDERPIPKLDHVHDLVKTDKVDATCEDDGNIEYYTCSKCGLIFSDAEGTNQINAEDTVIKATGHTYGTPTYTWAADYSSVTATAICTKDNHELTETVPTTSVVTAPTCEEDGIITYTAAFSSDVFSTQTKTAAGEAALDHDYDFANATYVWSDDNTKVTATATCKHDVSHTVSETATASKETTTPATCTEAGEDTYTAAFENAGFTTQTKTVAIDPLGHDWGEWTVKEEATADADGVKERVCKHDATHVEQDVLTRKSEVVKSTVIEVSEDVAAAGLTTPAAIESTLEEKVVVAVQAVVGSELAEEFNADTIAYYEVKLILEDELGNVIRDANGDPVELNNDNMPAGGVNVTFAFPAGITADNYSQYTFIVIHMFGEGANAGTTEQLTPTVGANGITVHVNSLSPFAVAAVKKPAADNGAGGAAGGTQKTATKASTPRTGDDSAIVLWAVLFLSCGAGAVVLGKKKLYGRK